MLRNVEAVEGFAIAASDGVFGHVKYPHFDDEAWTVRYFVVDAGSWLSNRRVLISHLAVGKASASERVLPVSLTGEEVRNSPDPVAPLSETGSWQRTTCFYGNFQVVVATKLS